MRHPTRRAYEVNSAAVTITARRWGRSSAAASILILCSISNASTAIADEFQKSPGASAQSSASDLTANGTNSAGPRAESRDRGDDSSPPRARLAPLEPSSADLDGLIFWLAPWGARTEGPNGADSCVGAELAVTRVREREALGLIGGSAGAGRYASSDAGRLWVNAAVGTRRGTGWMIGGSAGAILELSPTARPKLGASAGVWMFVGVVPFARLGTLEGRGVFAEVGVEIALPVLRWVK